MINTIARAEDVRAIAGHLADRDAFVITAGQGMAFALSARLKGLPGWTAYLDSGAPIVLRTDDPKALALTETVSGKASALVLTVPKVVPAVRLGKFFGVKLPADGSRDVLTLAGLDDQPVMYPAIFVDALETVDPVAAAEIRAYDAAHTS